MEVGSGCCAKRYKFRPYILRVHIRHRRPEEWIRHNEKRFWREVG